MKYGFPINDSSVSVGPNSKITAFSSTIPDYKNTFRAPFRKWAENALPGEYESRLIYAGFTRAGYPVCSPLLERAANTAADQKYVISLQEDGFPCLPAFDIDLVAPNDARLILKAYIDLTWSEFQVECQAVFHLRSLNVQNLASSQLLFRDRILALLGTRWTQ